MKRAIIASVLSFLGPGLGQIYNREPKKGWAFIGSSAVLFFLPSLWIMRSVGPAAQSADRLEIQAAVGRAALEHKHMLNIITFVFLGLWAYSITQAYFKGRELAALEPKSPEEP